MKDDALRRCPRCKRKAYGVGEYQGGEFLYWTECICGERTSYYKSQEEAIEAWNRMMDAWNREAANDGE